MCVHTIELVTYTIVCRYTYVLDLYFIILSCCSLVMEGPVGGAPHIRLRQGGGPTFSQQYRAL